MAAMTHDKARTGTARGRLASGLGLAAASASSFGLSGSLARGLMETGWSSAAAVVVRILIAAAVLVPVAAMQLRGRWTLLLRTLPMSAAYGLVAVAGCQLAYFNAVAHMQVGVALLIEYTAPVVVVGWLWARRGQRPGRLTALGLLLAAAGLVLVLDLASGAQASVTGILWAFGAMVGAAVYFLLSSDEDNGLPPTVLAAAGLTLGGLVLLLVGAAGMLTLTVSTRPVAFDRFTVPWWLPVLALGVVTAALAYGTGIAAARRLGSRLASFVALSEVLVALVAAWILLGEVPRAIQVVGGAFILAGVVSVKLGERPVTVHDFPITFPDGSTRPLSEYAGTPLLLVNVASKCGFTPQYEGLEDLARSGAVQVIGFPCNQFGDQEPGSDAEIAEFCSATYDVRFPITTKIEVNGPGADPLWVHLRRAAPGELGPDAGVLYEHLKANRPETIGTDEVKWNFTKFLVDGDGAVVRRYEPHETPERIAADL